MVGQSSKLYAPESFEQTVCDLTDGCSSLQMIHIQAFMGYCDDASDLACQVIPDGLTGTHSTHPKSNFTQGRFDISDYLVEDLQLPQMLDLAELYHGKNLEFEWVIGCSDSSLVVRYQWAIRKTKKVLMHLNVLLRIF